MTHLSRGTRLNGLALCAAVAMVLSIPGTAQAQSTSHDFWNFMSNTGAGIYLVAGTALPLLNDGSQGKNHFTRNIDSIIVSFAFTEGLKALTNEQRPDKSDHDSFPSEHASLTFDIAAMESAFHPKQAPLWYAGATIVSASRVALHKHFVYDSIAGALLGWGTARWELSQRHGLILTPWINGGNGAGLAMTARF
jgi:membrane-associated phospholipid phosphatase